MSAGAWRRNPVKEAIAITVSGKCERRCHDGGSGHSTVDPRAAKRERREGLRTYEQSGKQPMEVEVR